jgi:hypothetical protein
MKFQINIDCTPEEAREFFGLPDVLPMQQDLMEKVSRRLSENIQTIEPEILMKTWVPALFQGWTDVQSNFWEQFSQMGGDINKHKMDFDFKPSSKKEEKPSRAKPKKRK